MKVSFCFLKYTAPSVRVLEYSVLKIDFARHLNEVAPQKDARMENDTTLFEFKKKKATFLSKDARCTRLLLIPAFFSIAFRSVSSRATCALNKHLRGCSHKDARLVVVPRILSCSIISAFISEKIFLRISSFLHRTRVIVA